MLKMESLNLFILLACYPILAKVCICFLLLLTGFVRRRFACSLSLGLLVLVLMDCCFVNFSSKTAKFKLPVRRRQSLASPKESV